MTQQQPQEIQSPHWDYHSAGLPVGEIMRRTREHYGQSLDDVERVLRIRACQLSAIEEGRDDLLPGRVYAIGFVRAYAEYLGLPPDDMVHLFKAQVAGNAAEKAELHFPVPASESKVPGAFILSSSAVALLLVVGAFVFLMAGKQQPVRTVSAAEIPPVPEMLKAELHKDILSALENAPLEAAFLASIETAAGIEENAFPEVVIEAHDDVWIEVRDPEKKVLLSRILKAGDSYTVPREPGMMMDTGNMGALAFSIDGNSLPPLGAHGDVKRNFALDPVQLKASVPPEEALVLEEKLINPELVRAFDE